MLELKNIYAHYQKNAVLQNISFTVGNSVTAILGPSGGGKSTLLRVLAGLHPLSAGEIIIDGQDISHMPTHKRDFGMVFQDAQLFPGKSVADNIGYGLRMRRVSRAHREYRVSEMLELVGLENLHNQRASELSGGQAQRVALARALASRPRLLLLDEPFSALDYALRRRLVDDVAEIIAHTGTPTIVVTHDHSEAAMLAESVVVLDNSQIAQEGTPSQLWRTPATEAVAKFLGYSTFITATKDGPKNYQTLLGPIQLELDSNEAELALRAESVVASPRRRESTEVWGIVEKVSELPTGCYLRVSLLNKQNGPKGNYVAAVYDSGSESIEPVVGQHVSLFLQLDKIGVIAGTAVVAVSID